MPINSNVTMLRLNKKNKPSLLKKLFELASANLFLSILAFAVITSLISYTLVLYKESYLIQLHKKTVVTQMENVDIKTKVEFAKSLYNVQGRAETLSYLRKPEKVIEVEPGYKKFDFNSIEKNKPVLEKVVVGY